MALKHAGCPNSTRRLIIREILPLSLLEPSFMDAIRDESALFPIERVLAKRRHKTSTSSKHTTFYLVKWKGYGPGKCTWEHLDGRCKEVRSFEKRFKEDFAEMVLEAEEQSHRSHKSKEVEYTSSGPRRGARVRR